MAAAATPQKQKGDTTQDKAKEPKAKSLYTVLEKFSGGDDIPEGDVYVIIGQAEGRNDKDAIGAQIGHDGEGTFVAVPRFNERTVASESRPVRRWK
jgi:hypothetical protein